MSGVAARATVSRRTLLKGLGSTALAAAALPVHARAARAAPGPARRPNVVLVTADDLGPFLGCHGDTVARTPNLDAFARQGVRFDQAYVTQASCSPSRSSILTGLYPHQNGQVGLTTSGYSMRAGIPTLPTLLSGDGYRTGLVGKLHVEPESDFTWDYRARDATSEVAVVRDRARQFLRTRGTDPFFLMVNYFDPHTQDEAFRNQVGGLPADPHAAGSVAPFAFQGIDTPEVRERTRGYYNAVERLDAGIGMLLALLDAEGVLDDTLVIFLGDHGPGFSRAKTTCYEAGVKVPFLVRWPGHQQAGAVRTWKQVSTIDIVPTVLAATGSPGPSALPGRSLLPLLRHWDVPWRAALATEFTTHGPQGDYPRRAIRSGRFKLIRNLAAGRGVPGTGIDGDVAYDHSRRPAFVDTLQGRAMTRFAIPPPEELFDVVADPHEFLNLAGDPAYAAERDRLRDLLAQWQEQTDDPLR